MSERTATRTARLLVLGSLCGTAICGTGVLPAQEQNRQDEPEKRARRLVTFLELPERRRDACEKVLQLGTAAVPALTRKLTDPRPEVVFRCMSLLRRLGPPAKAALPGLKKLEKHDAAAIQEGARWCAHGIRQQGLTIVVSTSSRQVSIYDAKYALIRKTATRRGLYDAELLANGSLLVASINGDVEEIDANGKAQWTYKAGVAIDVDRLANGNTLISTGKNKKVIEVDRDGKIVWSWESIWPNDADRLPSGNTLVSDYKSKRLVEVDVHGKVVWEIKTPEGTIDAERLNNGNTLMVLNDSHVVLEVDPKGKTVREFRTRSVPKCAIRLASGHTLIGSTKGWSELDADGKEIHHNTGTASNSAIHRY